MWHHESREWRDIPLAREFVEDWRGLGVADMAYAVRDGRLHRTNGSLAYHVLDIMHAVYDASREGRHIELVSGCQRPQPLRAGEFNVVQQHGH